MSDVILFGRTQNASQTPFDNSTNGFSADNVQDAIEESLLGLTTVQTYMDVLRILAGSTYRTENGRNARILSSNGGTDATIIDNLLIVKSDGSTVVETASILRIT